MKMDSDSSNTQIHELSEDLILLMVCNALGGKREFVKSQDIMAKAFKLVKDKFCWSDKKYSHFPDLEKMRKALFAARTKGYLVGAYDRKLLKDGWKLTKEGLDKIEEIGTEVKMVHGAGKASKLNNSEKNLIKRFIEHKNINLINDDSFNIYLLAEIMSIPANNIETIRQRLFEISNLCEINNNKKCLEIINSIKSTGKFKELFDKEKFLNQRKQRHKIGKNT